MHISFFQSFVLLMQLDPQRPRPRTITRLQPQSDFMLPLIECQLNQKTENKWRDMGNATKFSQTWTRDILVHAIAFFLKTLPFYISSSLSSLPPILQSHIKSSAPAAHLSVTETSVFLSFSNFLLSSLCFPRGWPFLLFHIPDSEKKGCNRRHAHTE